MSYIDQQLSPSCQTSFYNIHVTMKPKLRPRLMKQECAYTLQYAEFTHRSGKWPWSIRRMTVYHQYHGKSSTPTWCLIGSFSRAEGLLESYFQLKASSIADFNQFEIHIMLLGMAVSSWTTYLAGVHEMVSRQVNNNPSRLLCSLGASPYI